MTGKVVTFYSYKGGVGRSFALANIGAILAQWGHRVLLVDWDIEAPGLRHYFPGQAAPARGGVIDFLQDCRRSDSGEWSDYAIQVVVKNGPDELFLMPAEASGKRDYADIVQDLNWDELYDVHGLGARLEELRSQWVREFDFILVDSRTGVTDFSGLTTAQLPDVLAFMFTANDQSLGGCVNIARRAMDARKKMPVDRAAILPLPIPARFEPREEFDRAQTWRRKFAKTLSPFFSFWAPEGADTLKLVDLLTIPYVPRWTFGEDLAVLLEPPGTDGLRSTGQTVSYAFETIAALFAQEFGNVQLLTSSRDEFVHGARVRGSERHSAREPLRLFVSRTMSVEGERITMALSRLFDDTYGTDFLLLNDTEIASSAKVSDKLQEAIESADAFIILVDQHFSSSLRLRHEIDQIQRIALRSDTPKPIIPFVMKDASGAFFKSRLANYFAIFLDVGSDLEEQLRPALERIALQLDRPAPEQPPARKRQVPAPVLSDRKVQAQRNGWSLTATVKSAYGGYVMTLEVGKTERSMKTLTGPVTFSLGAGAPPRTVDPVSGRARIVMLLSGATEVRALIKQDGTLLGLDWAAVPDVPPKFLASPPGTAWTLEA